MRTVRMYFNTNASASVRCQVPDDITDPWDVEEYVQEHAEFPWLSAQGSGWGQDKWFLELGDVWESEEDNGEPVVEETE